MGVLDRLDDYKKYQQQQALEAMERAQAAARERTEEEQTPRPASAPDYDSLRLPTPAQWASRKTEGWRTPAATTRAPAQPVQRGPVNPARLQPQEAPDVPDTYQTFTERLRAGTEVPTPQAKPVQTASGFAAGFPETKGVYASENVKAAEDWLTERQKQLEEAGAELDKAGKEAAWANNRAATNARAARKFAADAYDDEFARDAFGNAYAAAKGAEKIAEKAIGDYNEKAGQFNKDAGTYGRNYEAYLKMIEGAPVSVASGTEGGGGRGKTGAEEYARRSREAARAAAALQPTADMWLDPVTARTAAEMQKQADAKRAEAEEYAKLAETLKPETDRLREEAREAYREARAFQPTSDMYLNRRTAELAEEMQKQSDEAKERGDKSVEGIRAQGGRYGLKEGLQTVGENLGAGAMNAVRGMANALNYAGQEMTRGQLMEQQSVMSGLKGQQEIADSSGKLLEDMQERGLQNIEQTAETLGWNGVKKAGEWVRNFAQTANEHAQASGKAVRALAQTANGVGGMIPSILSNLAIPGSGMWVMAAQAAGNATEEALANGAKDELAVIYGGAVAAVEVLTEKMFGGIPGLGVGSLDDAVENLIKKNIGGEAAQRAILFLVDALGEGAEEFVSEFADWGLDKWLIGSDGRALGEVGKDALYSAFIGALTSVAMSAPVEAVKSMKPKQLADAVKQETEARLETEEKAKALELPKVGQATENAAQGRTAEELALPEIDSGTNLKIEQRDDGFYFEKGGALNGPFASEQKARDWASFGLQDMRNDTAGVADRTGNLPMPSQGNVAHAQPTRGKIIPGAGQEGPLKIDVGQATTIKNLYRGETPVPTKRNKETVTVREEYLNRAKTLITQAEQANTAGESSFAAALKKLYKNVFKRSSAVPVNGLTFKGKQYLVEIGNKVPGKLINDPNLSAEKLALLEMLPEVVNKANYVGSGEYSIKGERSKTVSRYDYFETPATIGESNYIVKFDVEVLPDINNYRTHQIVNVDLTTPGGSLVGPAPTASPDGTSPRDVAMHIVQEKDGGVKQEVKNGLALPAVPTQDTQQAEAQENLELPDPAKIAAGETGQTAPAETVTEANPLPTAEEWANRNNAETTSAEAPEAEVPDAELPADAADMPDGGYSANGYAASPGLRKLGVKIAEPITNTIGADVLVSQAQKAKAAEKALNKAIRKLAPTKAEKALAMGLADGTYTEGGAVLYGKDGVPIRDVNMNKVRELAEYYRQKNQYKRDRIAEQRRVNRDREAAVAEDLLKNADSFKKMSALRLNLNTMKRNMLAWAGQELGAKINSHLFDPVTKNSAERIRFVNRMLDRVRGFHLDKAESEMVQRVIEGTAVQDQVSKLTEDARRRVNAAATSADFDLTAAEYNLTKDEKDLAHRYHDWLQTQARLETMDAEKINAAAKAYSRAYSDFYTAINEFLAMHGYEPIGFIEGYAPHLQPENVQTTLGKVLSIFGMDAEVSALPTEIAGQTENYKPGKQWNPYFQHRAGADAMVDAVAGYESYVNYLSNVLYHTDDIQKLRVFINTLRGMYATEDIREKLDQAKWIRERSADEKADFLRINHMIDDKTEISPEMADDLIEKYVDGLYDSIENKSRHGDVASVLEDYANKLAGKQTKLDRAVESFFGRKTINFGNALSRIFGESAVVGNLSSALNQLSQLPAVQAEVGNRYVLQAVRDILRGDTEAMDQESDFLTGKQGTDSLLAERSWADSDRQQRHNKVTNAMSIPFEAVDTLASRVYVRAKYLQEIAQGASHEQAMRSADDFAERVVGNRIQGSRPMVFESKNAFVKLFSTFQLEVANAWAHISQDLPAEIKAVEKSQGKAAAVQRTAAILMRYGVSAFLLNRLTDALYGGTPTPFDLIGYILGGVSSGKGETVNGYLMGLIRDLFGIGDDDEEEDRDFDLGAALKESGSLMVGDMPFIRNAASMLGYGDTNLPLPSIGKTAGSLWDLIQGNGSWADLGGSALRDAATWLPGGNQMKKTVQGIETVAKQGKYNRSGNLMYPVDLSGPVGAARGVKAALFGPSSLGATDAYYASGDRALSEKQTKTYEDLVRLGEDRDEVYDTIMRFRKVDNVKDSDEDGKQKRDVLRGAELSDHSKAKLYETLFNKDGGYEELAGLMDYGITFDDCMDILDKYNELKYTGEKAGIQASRFAEWVDRNYEPEVAEKIKGQYRYWMNMPAEANAYEKARESGVDIETADKAMGIKNSAEGKKDENGETIDGSKKAEVVRGIAGLDIGDEEKVALLESMGYNVDEYKNAGGSVSLEDYAEALELKAMAKGKKNDKGDTVDGSKKLEVMLGVDSLDLTPDQKTQLMGTLGYEVREEDEAPMIWETGYTGDQYEAYYYMTDKQRKAYGTVSKFFDPEEYVQLLDVNENAKGKKDDKGNTVDGSKKLEVMLEVNEMELKAAQKTMLMEALGYDFKGAGKTPPIWLTDYSGKDYEAYYYMSDKGRETYRKYCDWLAPSTYEKYAASVAEFHNIKNDAGKTTVTKQAQVIAYIDALKLTPDQKTALYVAMGYNENLTDKGFKDCPWWNRLALRGPDYPTK